MPTRSDATPFVGRAHELNTLRRLFLAGHRLVTLRGPAGVGKSRLARRFSGFHPGSVWVDAAEARDADALGSAVQAALGVEVEAIDGLAAAGNILVVLDNLEQVADVAASVLSSWRAAAPDVRFLVTSRTRLRLPDEQVVPVEPLDSAHPRSDAVRLFAARARAVSGRDLLAEDADAVVALAHRLDGLPLALELAAGRSVELGPRELLDRLDAALDLLVTDTIGRPDRQVTLEAAIRWSWDLLDAEERDALVRCAAFSGEFDLDAAEAVLGPRAADALHHLCDDSLVQVFPDGRGGVRYRLYVAVAAFVRPLLDGHPDRDGVFRAHAAHYASPAVLRRTLAWIARYRHHLFAIVERFAGVPDVEARSRVLAAAVALQRVPHLAGTPADQRRRVLAAIDNDEGCPTALRVHGRLAAALLGTDRLDEALRLADGDELAAAVHARRGTLARQAGDRPRALAAVAEAAALAPTSPETIREIGRVWLLCDRPEDAREVLLSALSTDDDDVRGAVCADLARVDVLTGNLDAAAVRAAEAVGLLDGPESSAERQDARRLQALIAWLGGREDAARVRLSELSAARGWRGGLALAMRGALGDDVSWVEARRAVSASAPADARDALERWATLDGPPVPTPPVGPEGLLADAVRRHVRGIEAPAPVVIGPGAKWMRLPGGEVVDLSRRGPMRRILEALTENRLSGAGPLSNEALFEIGWPGQRIRADSAAHRVRVAVSSLRSLGLGDLLEHGEAGYALSAEARFVRG